MRGADCSVVLMPSLPPGLKRLLSIAFVAGVVFLGAKTCEVESADCELVFRFRDVTPPGLRELEVRLYDGDASEPLGEFRKYYDGEQAGPTARWPLVISAGTYRLEGILMSDAGARTFEREVELVDGEAISVYVD